MLLVMKKQLLTGRKLVCRKTRLHTFLQATTGGQQVQQVLVVLIQKFSTGLEKDFHHRGQTRELTVPTGWKSGTMFSCSLNARTKRPSFLFQNRM